MYLCMCVTCVCMYICTHVCVCMRFVFFYAFTVLNWTTSVHTYCQESVTSLRQHEHPPDHNYACQHMDVSFVANLIGGLQAISLFRYEHKTQGICLPTFVSLMIIGILLIILTHLIIIKSVPVKYVVSVNKHVLMECALKIKWKIWQFPSPVRHSTHNLSLYHCYTLDSARGIPKSGLPCLWFL